MNFYKKHPLDFFRALYGQAAWWLIAFILTSSLAGAEKWTASEPYRVILQVNESTLSGSNSVVRVPMDFADLLTAMAVKDKMDPYSLRVEALNGPSAGKNLPFRFDHIKNPSKKNYLSPGDLTFLVPDARTTRLAVYFGPQGLPPDKAPMVPLIGDGDILRVAGNGTGTFNGQLLFPQLVDFDGDGRRDLVGCDCWGAGAVATCFRNIGTDSEPAFSEREIYPLRTMEGKPISNPNRGWFLTAAFTDWNGDGLTDLLVGGWCRFLTFHKNLGPAGCYAFDAGKVIFDAKVFPGFDYGKDPDSPYQGVFIEPCDWDGDGLTDLLCGTVDRKRIYFLRNTGKKDAEGLPVLADPVALEANGAPLVSTSSGPISAGDWNGDGLPDLITCGPKLEGFFFFKNIGDRTHPKLAAGEPICDANGNVIERGFWTQAKMVDWNKDGKMDLLITGSVHGPATRLYLNLGASKEPRLTLTPIPYRTLASCVGSGGCGGFAYPVAYDLDKDGILDLIVGEGDGYVWFFKGLPDMQYASPVKLKSQGEEIHEIGCPDGGEALRGYVKVAVADWNGDGSPDFIMWTMNGKAGWSHGSLDKTNGWCLKFFPGTRDPLNFGPPVEIKADGRHIMAGYRSKPDVADLDGDGLLDLVVAVEPGGSVNGSPTVIFFKNIGAKTEWKLAAGVPLTNEDGTPIAVPIRTCVRLADWNRDGLLDLFLGSYGNFFRYLKNVGTKTQPRFAQPGNLRNPDPVTLVIHSHHEIGVDAVDLDGDGALDLLVGNGDTGQIHFFRRTFLEHQTEAGMMEPERRDGGRPAAIPVTKKRPK